MIFAAYWRCRNVRLLVVYKEHSIVVVSGIYIYIYIVH